MVKVRKSIRKFLALHLHHIDSSIIIEPEKTIDGKICRKYLQKIGYNYRGKFSSPVLSELFMRLLSIESYEDRDSFLRIIDHLVKKRKVDYYTPIRIGKLSEDIKEIDSRLEPHDIQIVACAIEDDAKNLITLDQKLIHNQSIEERYNLRISHPKEFI